VLADFASPKLSPAAELPELQSRYRVMQAKKKSGVAEGRCDCTNGTRNMAKSRIELLHHFERQ